MGIEGLLEVCQLNSYERLQQFVDDLVCEGFSGHQLINQLHDEVVTSNSLNDQNKAEICAKLATAESCLLDGADEYLQVMSVATYMMKVPQRIDGADIGYFGEILPTYALYKHEQQYNKMCKYVI